MTSPDPIYPFQSEGVEFLLGQTCAMLAFEPGLGKTRTAIEALDKVHARTVLVLCQAVGRIHWAREFARWEKTPRTCAIVRDLRTGAPSTDIVIVNYDIVSRGGLALAGLLKRQWDVIILDEAQALKNRRAIRTKKVYGPRCERTGGLAERANRVWLLTGTPTPNHSGELYPHMRALWPDTIQTTYGVPMNEDQFFEAFCTSRHTPYGRQITGSRNIDALRAKLEGRMLRKRKSEVLKDLPPLAFDTLLVSADDANVDAGLIAELAAAEINAVQALTFVNDLIVSADAKVRLEDVLPRLRMDGHIATQRRLAGRIKAHIVAEILDGELEGHKRKIIVFAHHQSVIDTLMDEFAKRKLQAVKLDGRDPPLSRQKAIDSFQTDPDVRIFVGQLQAAGTTITLTAASDVVIVEPSWTPSENVQAACRAHRIGQHDGVLVRIVSLVNSIDARINDVIARKSKEIAQLIDNEATELEPIV